LAKLRIPLTGFALEGLGIVDSESQGIEMTSGISPNQTDKSRIGTWSRPTWWTLLVVLPWAMGLASAIHDWNKDRKVARREKVAVGTITAHEVSNHNQYRYKFSIDGQSYGGLGNSPKDLINSRNTSKLETTIGEQVLVYYDPMNPSANALRDFSDLSNIALGPVPLMLIGIGAVTSYIYLRKREINLKLNGN
jgi:hypothetical protein